MSSVDPGELTIRQLCRTAYGIAADHGFHEPRLIDGVTRDASTAERLALIHEEVSEALMAYRHAGNTRTDYVEVDGKPEGFGAELADIVIRVADLAQTEGLDLESLIVAKMNFNIRRERFHGKAVL